MRYNWPKLGNMPALFFILAFCGLFISESAVVAAATEENAVPKIEFDAVEKDLGTIAEGDDKEFEFVVRNVGAADLRISRLRSLCDCVEVTIDETIIKPGSSARLQGVFHSAGRWGNEEKVIAISSNAQGAPQSRLKIRLAVESGICVTPRSFSFGEIAQKRSETKKIKIEARLEDQLELLRMEVLSAENVTSSILRRKVSPIVLPCGKNGYLTEIDIILKAENDSAGEFSGQLNIQTNSARNPQLEVLFSGEKTGDLEVNPAVAQFMDVIPGHTVKTVAIVKSLSNGPFRITGLDAGQLPITMGEVIDKALYEHSVKLVFTALEQPRPFYRGYVYILTDHSTQKRIKVGVNAVIRHPAQ